VKRAVSKLPSYKTAGVLVAIVAVLVVLILIFTPLVQSTVFDLIFSPFQKKVPASVTFEVERGFAVSANGGSIINFTLDVPMIPDIDSEGKQLQRVLDVSYYPAPTSLTPRYGIDWAVWQHGGLSGEESHRVRMVYQIKTEAMLWNLGSSLSGNLSDLPDSLTNRYLHDEWKIIVDDPRIQTNATNIVKGETNVYLILSAINSWMVDHVGYPSETELADPSTSVQTLESMIGDCDDQAILFCALARASGVPAWLQLGASYDITGHEWVGHGWVQTYVPLKSGSGEKVTIDTVNRDFMIWKPNRFAEFTDDGNGDHLYDYYSLFSCAYDSSSYIAGEGPEFIGEYDSISYTESQEKIVIDDFFQLTCQGLVDRELASVKRS